MVKPDLRTSEKVASWPYLLRYFWVLLWGYVDDHGKGRDNPLLVKADCFPLDADITGEVVDRLLWALVEADVLVRYTAAGTDYLMVKNWSEHQKPQHPGKDVVLSPDDNASSIRSLHASLMNDAGSAHATLTPELSRDELSRGAPAEQDAGTEPPLFCPDHPHGAKGNCGPCADARRLHKQWEQRPKPITPTARPKSASECAHEFISGTCIRCGIAARAS